MSKRNTRPHAPATALPVPCGRAVFAAAAALALAPFAAAPAAAQEARSQSEFNRPFGMGYGEETRPIDGSTRDRNGNRVIVNGRRQGAFFNESSGVYSETAGAGYGAFGAGRGPAATATAIGNNLTVITQGSYNTVIVDSVQENDGDQTVELQLKGSVDD